MKFSVKMHFYAFLPPEKSIFGLMTNLKFNFSESLPGSVPILIKPMLLFSFLKF